MIRALITAFAALAGLAFGSFLNVCLSRWPSGESVVTPRSHCRTCNRTLTWWENIPLLSWLALRGRCRTCKSAISWRYPAVELLVGVLWAYSIWNALHWLLDPDMPTSNAAIHMATVLGDLVFSWLLVALALLDAENYWLPDWLTLPGIGIGITAHLVDAWLVSRAPNNDTVGYNPSGTLEIYAFSALAAALLILAIRWVYWLIRRREGIGLGDAKLMALLAAWLGLPGALLSFVIGVILGAAVALIVIARAQQNESSAAQLKLPLGTFLCIGGMISSLWGRQILDAYLHWSGLN